MGVTLNLEKCKLFTKDVEYLGHSITQGKLYVQNNYADALRQGTFSKTHTQMRSFSGMCNVHRRRVLDSTKRTRPLNALTKEKIPPDLPHKRWKLKKPLRAFATPWGTHLFLALPKFGRERMLDVDARAYQLGCTLSQQDDDGKQKALGHWSRTLDPAELI